MNSSTFNIDLHGEVQFRLDPLTGDRSRINPARARRPKQAESVGDQNALQEMVQRSAAGCVFCPERILEKVPKFPAEIKTNSDGRIIRGESIIFPNLSPIGDNHAVGVSTKQHFLTIDGHSVPIIRDNMLAMKEFVAATHAAHPDAKWPSFFWNYMPPSAGSIIHPHSQLLVETTPLAELRRAMDLAAHYFSGTGANYFADLVEAERKNGVRFIGQGASGSVVALAVFAPRAVNEIWLVLPKHSTILDWDESTATEFAEVTNKLLHGYKAMGIGSFNMASFMGPISTVRPTHFSMFFKLFTRPYPRAIYTNDTGPMERVCGEFVIDVLPEDLAKVMAQQFAPAAATAADAAAAATTPAPAPAAAKQ